MVFIKKILKNTLWVLFLMTPLCGAMPDDCESKFTSQSSEVATPTDRLIAYLSELAREQILRQEALVEMHEALREGRLNNPISLEDATRSSQMFLHRKSLEKILGSSKLNISEIHQWLTKYLNKKSVERVERTNTQNRTVDGLIPMQFYSIPTGAYVMEHYHSVVDDMGFHHPFNQGIEQIPITLLRSFDLMSVLVTEAHWEKIMGKKNLSWHPEGKENLNYNNYPVQMVGYDRTLHFVNRMNELSKSGDPILFELIPDHTPGDTYRLPTEWERNIVDTFVHWETESELLTQAWLRENSNFEPHPVAELRPILINGNPFYDLFGSVNEYTESFIPPEWLKMEHLAQPVTHVRGGAFNNLAQFVKTHSYWDFVTKADPKSTVGFRLIRERVKDKK